jgi:hypothetical protein
MTHKPLLVLVLLASAGCSSKVPKVPASGRLLKPDGTPMRACGVYFDPCWPDAAAGFPFGGVDDDGHFGLGITAKDKRVLPGKYKVTLMYIDQEMAKTLPRKYEDVHQTPWEVTIPKTGKTDIVLQMEN